MHGQKKQTVPAAGTCWARLRYCPCCRHMHPCQAAHCCTALPITARLPRASTRLVGHQDAFRVGAATGRLGIISHQSGDVARPCRCIDGLRACVYSGMKQRGGGQAASNSAGRRKGNHNSGGTRCSWRRSGGGPRRGPRCSRELPSLTGPGWALPGPVMRLGIPGDSPKAGEWRAAALLRSAPRCPAPVSHLRPETAAGQQQQGCRPPARHSARA